MMSRLTRLASPASRAAVLLLSSLMIMCMDLVARA